MIGQGGSAREGDEAGRRILCVFPAYSPAFGTFDSIYRLVGPVRAFMPPQGILVIAAYLPTHWQVRFIDENIALATDADFAWCDAVFASGMHIQKQQLLDIARRAHAADKLAVLGGPSVSADPDAYAEFDVLHLGELGDATDQLVASIERSVDRPERQIRFETHERLPLDAFPIPAYHLLQLDRYFIASLQFSSGCPYRCEFCDIPALYGRIPRLKSPQRVLAELDAILDQGRPPAVYFVDDNFIGNRRAARELLPHLIDWQRRNRYPLQFACEATLNIARDPELLALMREAFFCTIFVGIETPEPDALRGIDKGHNLSIPILDAVRVLNDHGFEVVAGIILGLDGDRPDTGQRLLEFIEASRIPMLTINLLQALPRTPLWDRLEREGRLDHRAGRESNVVFQMPEDQVLAMWREVLAKAYAPRAVYDRFAHQARATYPNRIVPDWRGRLTTANLRRAGRIAANLLMRIGILGDYRREFWRVAWPELCAGRIEAAFNIGLVSHHLITFTREALGGRHAASFYAPEARHGRQFTRVNEPGRP